MDVNEIQTTLKLPEALKIFFSFPQIIIKPVSMKGSLFLKRRFNEIISISTLHIVVCKGT